MPASIHRLTLRCRVQSGWIVASIRSNCRFYENPRKSEKSYSRSLRASLLSSTPSLLPRPTDGVDRAHAPPRSGGFGCREKSERNFEIWPSPKIARVRLVNVARATSFEIAFQAGESLAVDAIPSVDRALPSRKCLNCAPLTTGQSSLIFCVRFQPCENAE